MLRVARVWSGWFDRSARLLENEKAEVERSVDCSIFVTHVTDSTFSSKHPPQYIVITQTEGGEIH